MLLELQKAATAGQVVARLSSHRTEFAYELGDWSLVIDAALGRDRSDALRADAARLCQQLEREPAALDRTIFEALFGGHFVAIALHRPSARAYVLRDVAGAKSVYWTRGGGVLRVGTEMHLLARLSAAPALSRDALLHLTTLDYLFDGETFYRGIAEVPMGSLSLATADPPGLQGLQRFDLALAEQENREDFATNVRALREAILQAHARRAGASNVVLLSGGIDSSVMLCALREVVDRSRLRAITFRVKGTPEDETGYAQSLAAHLGVPIERIEVDPADPRLTAQFESDLLGMNSPYFGRFIFGQFDGRDEEVYFAGQDTRLHTPDLNGVDKLAFGLLGLQQQPAGAALGRLLAGVASPMARCGASTSPRRWVRGLFRAALAFDLDRYLPRFFFKLNPESLGADGYDQRMIGEALSRVKVDWRRARSHRHLYNLIVAAKWGEQYTDDMRYLQDLAHVNGTHMALPFYDIGLARLSSALPFDQASRFMIGRGKFGNERQVINKVMLREAFKTELNEALFLRAKAVSRSQHLLFGGVMGTEVRRLLLEDRSRGAASVAQRLGVQALAERFFATTAFRPEDEVFLTKVYWLAVLALLGRGRDVD